MSIYTTNYISGIRFRKLMRLRRAGAYVFGFFVCALLVLYVWQRVDMIRMGYQVEQLKKEKAELVKTNEMLRIEAASLAAPDRIEAIAATRLGMRSPEDYQVVLVKRVDRTLGRTPDKGRQVSKAAPMPGRS